MNVAWRRTNGNIYDMLNGNTKDVIHVITQQRTKYSGTETEISSFWRQLPAHLVREIYENDISFGLCGSTYTDSSTTGNEKFRYTSYVTIMVWWASRWD